jgi:hypothetical protein
MTDEEKAAAEKAAAEKPKAATKTKARVIAAHGEHKVNDVVKLSDAELEAAVAGGWADPAPAAVAYAESLSD